MGDAGAGLLRVRAAGDGGEAGGGRIARRDRLEQAAVAAAPRAGASFAGIEQVLVGRVDDAGDGCARLDQGDVDGELAIALDEATGAVERIDQEPAVAKVGHAAGAGFLLGDDGQVRIGAAEVIEDDGLGGAVGSVTGEPSGFHSVAQPAP
jgi:hypothetical protein